MGYLFEWELVMGLAGCYSLDLYCDNWKPGTVDDVHPWDYFPHQYVNELGTECRKKARQAGWYISRDERTVLCPLCNKKSPFYKERTK